MSVSGSPNPSSRADHPRFKPPQAAYVHVPFCAHHCGYCNFSVIADRLDLVEDYLKAIEIELSTLGEPHFVETLYIGGGTPTQLAPAQLAGLLKMLREWLCLADGGELTIEANPEDLRPAHAGILRDAGVTRISLGVQSFLPDKLRRLDRQHTPADVDRSIDMVREVGAQLAIDVIFAAPGESLSAWEMELVALADREPDHVSCYGLTYERGTQFYNRLARGALTEIEEETQRQQYELAIETLTRYGFEHYEVSNFALPGSRSRHNQAYWQGATFLGMGPGAARFVDGQRALNHRSPTTYLKRVLAGKDPTSQSEPVTEESYARDGLVFGLRMLEGIERQQFEDQTGYTLENLAGEAINFHLQQGFLTWTGPRLHLTRAGLLVSDAIWPDLI